MKFLRGGEMSEVGHFETQNEPKIHQNEGKRRENDGFGKGNGGYLGSTVTN